MRCCCNLLTDGGVVTVARHGRISDAMGSLMFPEGELLLSLRALLIGEGCGEICAVVFLGSPNLFAFNKWIQGIPRVKPINVQHENVTSASYQIS